MPVRMKDIARDVGVSVVTVSKVLRNHPDIAEQTKKRILKRMKELNYHPNFAARSLITGRTCTIGLVVPDLLHPFFAQIANAISDELRKHGYSLIISSSAEDPELEMQELDRLLTGRVDAILVASSQQTSAPLKEIERQGIPYILLDRHFPHSETNFVGVDDEAVGELATTHLIEQGCRRVAHIRGPEVSTAIGRLNGYKQAHALCHMSPLSEHVVSIGNSGDYRGEEGGYMAAKTLLAGKVCPDGIFCFNDPVALGAMRAILEAGLRIPEDVSIVGCGNLSYSDFLRVPLTSVDQDTNAIGAQAASLALKLANNKVTTGPSIELIQPHLVVRASSLRLGASPMNSPFRGSDHAISPTRHSCLPAQPVDEQTL